MPFIIISILTLPWILARLAKRFGVTDISARSAGIWGLGLAFLFFAVGHFLQTEQMVELLPQALPLRTELVWITGMLEIAIGCMLFFRKTQRTAASMAFAALVLFFPANVYGALNAVDYGGHSLGPAYLIVRIPLQLLLLFWTYWFGLRRK